MQVGRGVSLDLACLPFSSRLSPTTSYFTASSLQLFAISSSSVHNHHFTSLTPQPQATSLNPSSSIHSLTAASLPRQKMDQYRPNASGDHQPCLNCAGFHYGRCYRPPRQCWCCGDFGKLLTSQRELPLFS